MKNLKIKRVIPDGSVLSFTLSNAEMYNAYCALVQSYRKEDAKNALCDYMTELVDEFPILLKMPFMDPEREMPKKKIRKQIVKTMTGMFTDNASIPEIDEWYGIARNATAANTIPYILSYLSENFKEKDMADLERFMKKQISLETGTLFLRKKEYDITKILEQKKATERYRIRPEDLIILQSKNTQPLCDAQILLLALESVLLANPDTKFWHLLKFLQEKDD